jgi:hypothetical protein
VLCLYWNQQLSAAMRIQPTAVIVSLFLGVVLSSGATTPAAYAAGGGAGGGGVGPPVVVSAPAALTVAFEGPAPGLPDGNASLRFRLKVPNPSLASLAITLFEETCTVQVKAQVFVGRLGSCTAGGVPSAVVASSERLIIEYARATTPEVTLGTVVLTAAAYALTLSPNAVIDGPVGLTVLGHRSAIDAVASSSNARGLIGASTTASTSSFPVGVEGRAASAAGAGGHFVNTGGGDLFVARSSDAANPVFRVTNQGNVVTPAGVVPTFGPQGAQGPPGDKGPKGALGAAGEKGSRGEMAAFPDFPVIAPNSCQAVCKSPAVLKGSVDSDLDANHDTKADGCFVSIGGVTLTWAGANGACCVCGKP